MTLRMRLLAALLPALAAPLAGAQAYPVKSIRFVVAFPPGGIADVAGRLVAAKIVEPLGQQVVVDNRGGAAGNIAATIVARANPDGYTALVTTTAWAVNPSLYKKAGYDPARDFAPVVNVASSPNLISVHPSLALTSLREIVEASKRAKLSYSSPGSGTTSHLTAEYLFRVRSGADIVHAPFGGGGPAVTAAAGGQVQIVAVPMSVALAMVKAGKLRGVAVTSTKRMAALPEVATVAEQGFPGFEDYTWVGVFLPAGSPAGAVGRLNAEIVKALGIADTRERLAALGLEPVGGTPAEFARYLQAELARWAKVVRATGVTAD